MQCETHPSVETHLTCQKCGKTICFQCMVQTPVGYRCEACARVRPNPLLMLSNDERIKVYGAAIGLAVAGGVIWGLIADTLFGFLFIIAALGIGYLIAEGMVKANNGRNIPTLKPIVAVSAAAAYFVGNVLGLYWWDEVPLSSALAHFYANDFNPFTRGYHIQIWGVLSGLLSVAMAVTRIRG